MGLGRNRQILVVIRMMLRQGQGYGTVRLGLHEGRAIPWVCRWATEARLRT